MKLKRLKQEQLKLAEKVITTDEYEKINLIGGCDQTFINNLVISCIVICDWEMNIIETSFAKLRINFPYIPGYLAFREIPPIIKAFKKLKNIPDILLCDFNGILHPRRIGAASHLGILLDIPTIGIAKSLLLGKIKDDKIYIGNELRGAILKIKKSKIYVSPGHKVSLKSAVKIVKRCIKNHKMPEPIFLAHRLVTQRRLFTLMSMSS